MHSVVTPIGHKRGNDEFVLTVLLMCWGMVSYGGWF